MRGLIREMASIIGVVLGFYAANTYYAALSSHLEKLVTTPGYAHALSYFLLFIGTMLVVSFVVWVVTAFLKLAMLTTANHALGGLFGLAKGVALCAIVLLALDMFLPKAEFLTGSQLAPHLRVASKFLARFLPNDMQDMKDKVMKKGAEAVLPDRLPEQLKGLVAALPGGEAAPAKATPSKTGPPGDPTGEQLARIREFLAAHPAAREALRKELQDQAREPEPRSGGQAKGAAQAGRLQDILAANPAFREALASELAAAQPGGEAVQPKAVKDGQAKDVAAPAPAKETVKPAAKPAPKSKPKADGQ
jgi:membrane protein required for colicin V production